jgi:hypothetical protein
MMMVVEESAITALLKAGFDTTYGTNHLFATYDQRPTTINKLSFNIMNP